MRSRTMLLALAAIVLIAAAKRRAVSLSVDALTFRANAARTASIDVTGPRDGASVRWRRETVSGTLSVLAHRGRLHLSSNTRPGDRATVVTLDASTGALLWTYRPRGRIATPLAADGDTLLFGSDDGLYALRAEDGVEAWFVPSGAVWSAPLITRRTIFYGDTTGLFHALDAVTRTERWQVRLSGTFPSEAAVANGIVVVSTGATMLALAADTGAELWRFDTPSPWMPHAIADGRVFAGTGDQRFYALDLGTGAIVWSHRDPPVEFGDWSSPAIANGVVIAANRSGDLTAFEAADGAVRWRFRTIDRGAFPVIANGVVYFGITGHGSGTATTMRSFYALDVVTGTELWNVSERGLLLEGEPAIAGGTIYVPSVNGFVLALR